MSTAESDARWLRVAGVLGAIAVAAGAFGAHALEGNPRLETWKTGAHYHLIHALALAVPGVPELARRFWLAGIAIFAGTLYALVLLDLPILGAITPFGGVAFILGWLSLLWSKR